MLKLPSQFLTLAECEVPMIPVLYNMVNLDGLDISELNGSVVSGIYQKVTSAISEDRVAIFYHWYYAGIIIPPAYVNIDDSVSNRYVVNGAIVIQSDDRVSTIGNVPVVDTLSVVENGTYTPPSGVTGFDTVTVNVPDIPPDLETLTAVENGTYLPSEGKDGFSEVVVNVPDTPPVLETLTATQNGNYTPSQGKDGFSEVTVNVQPVLQSLSVSENGVYTPSTGYDGFSSVEVEVAGSSELPSAYQQVEYIELTSAQYFRFLSDGLPGKICNLVVSKTASSGDRTPLATSPEKAWSATFSGLTIKIYSSAGGICYGESMGASYTVTPGVKNGYLLKLPTSITGLNVGEYRYDTHNELFDGKIYEFVIYDNTLAVYRKFIPCRRKSDNVAGFYEIKTETFCVSESATPFIAGNDI